MPEVPSYVEGHPVLFPDRPDLLPRRPETREVLVREHVRKVPVRPEPGPALARTSDPETSHAAARTVNVTRRVRLVAIALFLLGAHPDGDGPARDEDVARKVEADLGPVGIKSSPSGLRTGRKEAETLGLVEECPWAPGVTESGRACRTFRLTAAGMALADEVWGQIARGDFR